MSENEDPSEETEFAAKAREAFEQNAQLKRENALIRAGVDPDSDQAKLVSKLISDDDFTAETVKSTLDSLQSQFGGGNAKDPEPEPQPEPQLDDPRRQAAQQYGQTTQGVGDRVEEPPPPDRLEAGYQAFDAARRKGTSVEDAAHNVLGSIVADVMEKGSASVHAWEGWDADARKREAAR